MSTSPPKGRADYLELGDWNATCGQCGRKRKASTMRQLPAGTPGAGLWVCYPEHWEARHPQEYVRGVPDKMAAPWVQQPADTFVTDFCTLEGISCLADYAVADCAIADLLPTFDITDADLQLVDDTDELIVTDTGEGIFV